MTDRDAGAGGSVDWASLAREVYRSVARALGDEAEAQDVCQEALMRIADVHTDSNTGQVLEEGLGPLDLCIRV